MDEAEVTLPTVELQLESVDQGFPWLGGDGSGAVLATILAHDAHRVTYTLTYEVGWPSEQFITIFFCGNCILWGVCVCVFFFRFVFFF